MRNRPANGKQEQTELDTNLGILTGKRSPDYPQKCDGYNVQKTHVELWSMRRTEERTAVACASSLYVINNKILNIDIYFSARELMKEKQQLQKAMG